MSRKYSCGFETGYFQGVNSAGSIESYPLGSVGGVSASVSIIANPAWWSSRGARIGKIPSSATSQNNGPYGHWHGWKWGLDNLPSSESTFWSTANFKVTVDQNGIIRLYNTTQTNVVATSVSGRIRALTCHLIEIRGEANNHELWVDGSQIGSTNTASANDLSAENWGFACPGTTTNMYLDDMYVNNVDGSASGQNGRRGFASVLCLSPNTDVGSSPAGFTNSGGLTFGNATTGWFSAVDDALPFVSSGTDFLGKSTANANVVELGFADSVLGITPTAVHLVAMLSGVSAASCNSRFTLTANGADQTEQAYSILSTTPQVACYYADLASSGVAWTKALLDGATAKFGNSSDVSPNPKLNAIYLMYETLDPSGPRKSFQPYRASVHRAALR